MSEPRKCQGCGATEGEPQVVRTGPFKKLVPGIPCRLREIRMADYGHRLLCSRCEDGFHVAAKKLAGKTMVKT